LRTERSKFGRREKSKEEQGKKCSEQRRVSQFFLIITHNKMQGWSE